MRRRFLGVLTLAALAAMQAGAAPLKLLTYNVGLLKVFGTDYVPLVDERAKLAPAEVARLADAEKVDIILLEEVWRAPQARAIVAALSPLGYAAVEPSPRSIVGLSSGLLLLVRAPLEVADWRFTRFRARVFPDSMAMKGVLEATVRDPRTGDRLAVVGTHTVAVDIRGGQPSVPKQLAAILSQVGEIVAALERRSENGAVPAVLLGDFNVGPGYVDQAYRQIADVPGIEEAGAALGLASPLIIWDPSNPLIRFGRYPSEPAAAIDHVFLRGGTGRRWSVLGARLVFQGPVGGLTIALVGSGAAVAVPLSDHYGFLVEAELSSP